jgi:signal transduction histidine kinase
MSERFPRPAQFLAGGEEMGERLRAYDWAATPLGEPGSWPHALKTLVALMLSSRQPMFMAWGREHQVWLYNDAFIPIMGDKHPQRLGRHALREVWSEARDALTPLFDRVFAGEPVRMEDFSLELDRHGRLEEAHFSFSYTPVRDESGSIQGLFGACIEITDSIALRASEARLRDNDRRKDEFLATLAHELRNPLAPLRSAIFLMKSAPDAGRVQSLRDMMERQVDQIVRLVDDLLDVSRITQGKIVLRMEPVDIAAVVSGALETAAPAVSKAGCRTRVSLPAQPTVVNADAVRLTQVLSNLINNAAKFSDSGATIDVSASVEADHAVISVADQGIGIAPEKLEEIFEMFSQLDASLDRTKSGLGLGLPLARRLVELHGGTLRAASAGEGRGSVFTVRLPLVALPADVLEAAIADQGHA